MTEGELRADRSGGERRFDGLEPGVDTALFVAEAFPTEGFAAALFAASRRAAVVACSSTSRSAAVGSRERSLVITLARPSASPTSMHSRPKANHDGASSGWSCTTLPRAFRALWCCPRWAWIIARSRQAAGSCGLTRTTSRSADRASSMRPAARYKAERLNQALAWSASKRTASTKSEMASPMLAFAPMEDTHLVPGLGQGVDAAPLALHGRTARGRGGKGQVRFRRLWPVVDVLRREALGHGGVEEGQLFEHVEHALAVALLRVGDAEAEPGVGVVRLEVERLEERVHGVRELTFVAAENAQAVPGRGEVALGAHRFPVGTNGLGEVLVVLVQAPQPVPGGGQVGVEAHGVLEGRIRLAVLALGAVGTAEAVPGAGHGAVEAQGLAEDGNGFGRARVVLEEGREVVPRERVLGPQADQLASSVERLAPGPGDAVERDELAPDVGQVGPANAQLSVRGDRVFDASLHRTGVS